MYHLLTVYDHSQIKENREQKKNYNETSNQNVHQHCFWSDGSLSSTVNIKVTFFIPTSTVLMPVSLT